MMMHTCSVVDFVEHRKILQLIWFATAWGVGLLVVLQVFGDYLPLMFTSNTQVIVLLTNSAHIVPVICFGGVSRRKNVVARYSALCCS